MTISRANYSLLLTVMEPDSPYWDMDGDGDLRAHRNVCLATYEQGETFTQDRLILGETVAREPFVDEEALASIGPEAGWILNRGEQTVEKVHRAQPPRQVFTTGADAATVSASQRYVWTRDGNSLGQWDDSCKQWQAIYSGEEQITALAADPVRDRLIFALRDSQRRSRLYVYQPGVTPQLLPTPVPIHCSSLALSPNGRKLAFVDSEDSQVKVCDLQQGTVHVVSKANLEAADDCPYAYRAGDYASPVWSPDGQRLFYTRASEGVDMETTVGYIGRSLYVVSPDGAERRCMASARNGDLGIYTLSVGPLAVP